MASGVSQPVLSGGEPDRAEGIASEHFVWVLGALCRLNRLPFDAALALQQLPPPYSRANLIEGARALSFKAAESTLSPAPAALESGKEQRKALGMRLMPVRDSDQPVVANYTAANARREKAS